MMAWFKRQVAQASEGIAEAKIERIKAEAQLRAAQEFRPRVRQIRGEIDNLGRDYTISFTPKKAG